MNEAIEHDGQMLRDLIEALTEAGRMHATAAENGRTTLRDTAHVTAASALHHTAQAVYINEAVAALHMGCAERVRSSPGLTGINDARQWCIDVVEGEPMTGDQSLDSLVRFARRSASRSIMQALNVGADVVLR